MERVRLGATHALDREIRQETFWNDVNCVWGFVTLDCGAREAQQPRLFLHDLVEWATQGHPALARSHAAGPDQFPSWEKRGKAKSKTSDEEKGEKEGLLGDNQNCLASLARSLHSLSAVSNARKRHLLKVSPSPLLLPSPIDVPRSRRPTQYYVNSRC